MTRTWTYSFKTVNYMSSIRGEVQPIAKTGAASIAKVGYASTLQLLQLHVSHGAFHKHSVIEPSEELRIGLCRTFSCLLRSILSNGAEATLDKYYPDIIFSLQTSLLDPFPDLNIEACNILVQLLRIPHWEQGAKYFATGLARSALHICRHRNSRVVIAAVNLFEASVCVPDMAKVKGAGTKAIADLVGFQEENVSSSFAHFCEDVYQVT